MKTVVINFLHTCAGNKVEVNTAAIVLSETNEIHLDKMTFSKPVKTLTASQWEKLLREVKNAHDNIKSETLPALVKRKTEDRTGLVQKMTFGNFLKQALTDPKSLKEKMEGEILTRPGVTDHEKQAAKKAFAGLDAMLNLMGIKK